jgi:manganese-transporting P-type ATPase
MTLMCGDGTNDVGALKQAHVGVALLDGAPVAPQPAPPPQPVAPRRQPTNSREVMEEMRARMKEAEAEGDTPIVRLGDASIASPFTSRTAAIDCGKELNFPFSPPTLPPPSPSRSCPLC